MEHQHGGIDAGPLTESERLRRLGQAGAGDAQRFQRLGQAAARESTSFADEIAQDVLSRLDLVLSTVYEHIDHVRQQITRAELLNNNLEPETIAADDVQKAPTDRFARPPTAPGAVGRCQQVREAMNLHGELLTRLDLILARCEAKLYGEG